MFSPFTTKLYEYVNSWMGAFNFLDNEPDTKLWESLVDEELSEFLKEAIDLLWVLEGLRGEYLDEFNDNGADDAQRRIELLSDALIGIFGDDMMHRCLHEVYNSNMSKLGEDGKPIYREDGKILKGPNYVPADISSLVDQFKKVHSS